MNSQFDFVRANHQDYIAIGSNFLRFVRGLSRLVNLDDDRCGDENKFSSRQGFDDEDQKKGGVDEWGMAVISE